MIKMSKDSLYIRWFVWLWQVDHEDLNLCKLFWGTVLFPLSFLKSQFIFGFIPRLTVIGLGVSAIFFILNVSVIASGILGSALGYASYDVVTHVLNRKRASTNTKEDKNRRLSKVTGRASSAIEWIFENTLGRAIDAVDDLSYTDTAEKIGGFVGVISAYIRAIKHRTCPTVKVE